MLAFAANSILARLALAEHSIDPLAYTGIRLASGALVLAVIAHLHIHRSWVKGLSTGGSWAGALALLLYAITFSIAYLMIGAGTGALVLFASVQIGMLAWAIIKGDRPRLLEWLGIGIAFAGLVYLVSPGLAAPRIPGVLLMAIAGLSWGAYSLIGRGSRSPLADSAGNFVRCAPVGVGLICVGLWSYQPSGKGLTYAVASGMIASGLGYITWYTVLPDLSRTRAAFVQLTVPAIAAAAGVAFIGEPVTLRLSIAMVAIIGGVALGLLASARRTGTDLPRRTSSEDSAS
jgi:drug/metabolite transporter (DMT)-like permease